MSNSSDETKSTDEDDEEEILEEHWDVSCEDILRDFNEDDDNGSRENSLDPKSQNGALSLILMFLLLWAAFYHISAAALNHLIQFLRYALSLIAPGSPVVAALLASFPTSLYALKKHFHLSVDQFEKYVICPKCCSLYNFRECLSTTSIAARIYPKTCNHVAFRNHPIRSHRKPCGHNLLKEVITKTDRKFYPLKSYCYYPIVKSLSAILNRQNLIEQCEHWRARAIPNNTLADIYDGRVWQQFLTYKGRPFLSDPHNIGLMLNCDWFQPFNLTNYSVGVLYMVILNLPRTIRFKPENILIVGIIPGPSEPNCHEINSFLRPLVKELNMLWNEGFSMMYNGNNIVIHAALLATVCDVPATAKLGGFLSHASKHACWKCSKVFPYNSELNRVDFSGVQLGPLREHTIHKHNAIEAVGAATPTQRNEIELRNGSRFTELMHLPYYDCVRFSIIDPMHNLFLGTSKRMFHQWTESGLISRRSLQDIQDIVQKCTVPSGIGRIPHKIASNFTNLTADEWKNWTLLFSQIALHNILPEDHLKCWQLYISACNIYCSSVLTLDDIAIADGLMKSFFTAAESLYGPSFITINSHLHLHLQNVFTDYGPCYGFWLFSFERYNGMLGKYHTNQLSIEIQLMRRFIETMHIRSIVNTDTVAPEHLFVFKDLLGTNSGGSANETLFGQTTYLGRNANSLQNCVDVKLLPPFTVHHFDSISHSNLRICYQSFLPDVDLLEVPQLCQKYKSAVWWSQRINSSVYPKKALTCIQAYWIGEDGAISNDSSELCAGRVEYFFSQRLLVGNDYIDINMAHVKWFQEHNARKEYLNPVEIWCSGLFKPFGPASFIPVEKIQEVCITCDISMNGEVVTAINPIKKKVFL